MITGLPRLHAVTDDRVIAGGIVARAAAMARVAGAMLAVHVRTRTLEGGAFLALAREVQAAIAPHGSWLVVNGRADIARAAGARAVVSGRGGLAVRDVRRVAPGILVARSVHDKAALKAAVDDGADFVIASTNQGSAPSSLFTIHYSLPLPTIAIGGITPARTAELLSAGAWGVAAIRALWDAPDAAAAAAEFLSVLPQDQTVSVVINGETRRARRGVTLAGLLADLGLDPRAVVVEHNRGIVRRDDLAGATIAEGDTIELVHFVGGG